MKRFVFSFILCIVLNNIAVQAQQDATDTTALKNSQTDTTAAGRLDSIAKSIELKEVRVNTYRRMVKLEGGRLSFDLPAMVKNTGVTNIYEALERMPGMYKSGDELKLSGASSYTILIDGKAQGITPAQVIRLLKSMPVERLAKAELMYAAPPETGVRGAAINIILKENSNTKELTQGVVTLHSDYEKWLNSGAGINLYTVRGRWQADFNLSANPFAKSRNGEDMETRYTLTNGKTCRLFQKDYRESKKPNWGLYASMTYHATQKNKLRLRYYGTGHRSETASSSVFRLDENNPMRSYTDAGRDGCTHYTEMDWTAPNLFDLSAYYTAARQNSNTRLRLPETGFEHRQIKDEAALRIHTLGVRFSRKTKSMGNIQITYGIGGQQSVSKVSSRQFSGKEAIHTDSELKESLRQTWINTIWKPSEKISLETGFTIENYRLRINGKRTLANRWDFYPQLTVNWVISPKHILILSMTSDKTYPTYSELSPTTTHINPYSIILGNPELIPSRGYSGAVQYIFLQRYMISAFIQHTKDDMMQVPYQMADKIQTQFKTVNFDYTQYAGINLTLPFVFKQIKGLQITSQMNAMIQSNRLRNFHGMDVKRSILLGQGSLTIDYKLPVKPDITLNMSASGHTDAIQGTFDIGKNGTISAGSTYTFMEKRAALRLRIEDIFNSSGSHLRVRYGNQWSNMYTVAYKPSVSIIFTYNFGGYKKSTNDIDIRRYNASKDI
ncbi:outer membrane beta-barrel protein [Porphyromonas macacae]|nr:outer membrane beta-barrel protein [Porphyromonas macacae]